MPDLDERALTEAAKVIEKVTGRYHRSHAAAEAAIATYLAALPELEDEQVERAAYPIFVGVAKAPWTSRADDELCPVAPFSKNQARNIARAALQAAQRPSTPEAGDEPLAAEKLHRAIGLAKALSESYASGTRKVAVELVALLEALAEHRKEGPGDRETTCKACGGDGCETCGHTGHVPETTYARKEGQHG